jgi:hypothetical protein
MQTLVNLVGAVLPFVLVFLVLANIKRPVKEFLVKYVDESLAQMGVFFISVVLFFYAAKYAIQSISMKYGFYLGHTEGIGFGGYISSLLGPVLSTCDSTISLIQWVVNMAALFFIGFALVKGKRSEAA